MSRNLKINEWESALNRELEVLSENGKIILRREKEQFTAIVKGYIAS